MNAEERYARAEARAVARVEIGNLSPRHAVRLIEEECVKEIRAAEEAAKDACEELVRIYFDIAAEAIGEDAVREKRDAAIRQRRCAP